MAKLSQRHAAKHLDVSPSTFTGYIRAGRGPRHVALPGGGRRFDVADLDAHAALHLGTTSPAVIASGRAGGFARAF